jgi:hypothetical protein
MNQLIHADIFFFITTIAVVLVTLGLLIILWYALLILRDVREIAEKAKDMTGKLELDFEEAREAIKRKGRAVSSIGDLFLKFVLNLVPRPKSRHKEKREED